jgi:hypothetical protein
MPDPEGNTKADEETLPETPLHADKHADPGEDRPGDEPAGESPKPSGERDSGAPQSEQDQDEAPGLGDATGAAGGPDDTAPEDTDPPSGPEKASLP